MVGHVILRFGFYPLTHHYISLCTTQASNGGGSVGLRCSKRKGIQHGRDRDDDDDYNRDSNPKKGRLSKYHPKRVNITLNVVAAAPFGCRQGGTTISCISMTPKNTIQVMIT